MNRYAMVIKLNEEMLEEYKALHKAVWSDVLKIITECNIRNYSIYLHKLDDADYHLFSYFEYVGHDFDADMAKLAGDAITQKWWDICKPCQKPLKNRAKGEWWANMTEVFHHD